MIIAIKHKNPKIFHEDTDDREHLTSEEFISGSECSINSFVIMKKKYHLEKFYFEEEFTSNTSIDFSDSDYLNNELAISFLKHFDALTSKFMVE